MNSGTNLKKFIILLALCFVWPSIPHIDGEPIDLFDSQHFFYSDRGEFVYYPDHAVYRDSDFDSCVYVPGSYTFDCLLVPKRYRPKTPWNVEQ